VYVGKELPHQIQFPNNDGFGRKYLIPGLWDMHTCTSTGTFEFSSPMLIAPME
jgi:hypothetical protein